MTQTNVQDFENINDDYTQAAYQEDLMHEIINMQSTILEREGNIQDLIQGFSILHTGVNYLLYALVFLIGLVLVAVFFIAKGAAN